MEHWNLPGSPTMRSSHKHAVSHSGQLQPEDRGVWQPHAISLPPRVRCTAVRCKKHAKIRRQVNVIRRRRIYYNCIHWNVSKSLGDIRPIPSPICTDALEHVTGVKSCNPHENDIWIGRMNCGRGEHITGGKNRWVLRSNI